MAIFGGAPIRDQAARLKDSQIVVGTVGRVMDMIGRHHLFLDNVRYVILDEADEMLDLGFLEDVESILRRAPMGRQTGLFSATVPPEIRRLADTFMHDPVEIKVRAATLTIDTVDHSTSRCRTARSRTRSCACSRRSGPSRRSCSCGPRSASTGSRAASATPACASRRCTATCPRASATV